ncbi:MAG: Gfo/Idh/MocA family oxidoreductase [Candidatus Omnitrophica bacterium]|nr:Gfo/Idh/MocA family oxidoreductase [Candidatus Omnitrophota bacterium]
MKLNVGVIGTGYWGSKHVAEYGMIDLSAKGVDGINVITCDIIDDDADYSSYTEMINAEKLDSVSICTPNKTHYPIALYCIGRGVNTIIEKPMTLNYNHAKRLVNEAKDSGVVLCVGHEFRFNNALIEAKKMIDNGVFGIVKMMDLKWESYVPPENLKETDILFDLAPHTFDICSMLQGQHTQIERISCNSLDIMRNVFEDYANIICVYHNGTTVNTEIGWLLPPKTRVLKIIGDKLIAVIDILKQDMELYSVSGNVEYTDSQKVDIIPSNTIGAELEHFLKLVLINKEYGNFDDEDNIISGEIGADSIRFIEFARSIMNNGEFIYD